MTENSTLVISPGGKKLAEEGNAHAAMTNGLKAWQALPAADRKPKELPDLGYADPPSPPANGLILKAYSRALLRDEKGTLHRPERMTIGDGKYGWKAEPQVDFVWLTEAEWKSLLPAEAIVGRSHPIPQTLVERIAMFHLLDKGLSTPDFFWSPVKGTMSLTIEEATAARQQMKLEGEVQLGSNAYPVKFRGQVVYDVTKKAITTFEMTALGRNDGDQRPPEQRIRPRGLRYEIPKGRVPLLAVAFDRVDGVATIDRVPPYALLYDSAKNYGKPYFPKEK